VTKKETKEIEALSKGYEEKQWDIQMNHSHSCQ